MNDLYTKAVLSIIAASLLALVAQNAVRPSQAQSDRPQKVQICDSQNCADLRRVENSTFYGLVVAPARGSADRTACCWR
jgi:hypothetical protein